MAKSSSEPHHCNAVNLLSSLKVYSLAHYPHYLHPNNTLFLSGRRNDNNDDDDDTELFTPSMGVRSAYPMQLHLPTSINAKVEQNIVLKLVHQKQDYINNVAKSTNNYKRTKAGRSKWNTYDQHLNHLMELTTKDPDPYFFGAYNWYYTGGALEIASIYDIEFLFYVTGQKLNVFNSAMLSTKNGHLHLDHLDSTNQVICDTIYEIIKSPTNGFVAARQKHKFAVFSLLDDFAQNDFYCERNIPFLSGAFNENNFFTIDAKRVVQRHDLVEHRECGRMYLKLAKNNNFWCQIQSYNQQLIFADHKAIKLYDSRLFGRNTAKCLELGIDCATEKCEQITCVRGDASENNVYVTTTHNLFVFDVRYGMESGNQLARYTHQIKTPPFMIDASGGGATGCAPNERLIAMAGTFSDDMAIAQHIKIQNDKIRTHNIPQQIRGLSDVYTELRETGLHAEATEALSDNNRLINIGTRFARIDSHLYLLSEKSSAEIFYQQITADEPGASEPPQFDEKLFRNQNLSKATDSMPTATGTTQNQQTPAKVTTVTNFNSIKRILNYKFPNESEIPDIKNPQPKKWQQTMEQLLSYKDMLSADLLHIWSDQNVSNVKPEKTDRTEYVSGWINQADNDGVHFEHDSDA